MEKSLSSGHSGPSLFPEFSVSFFLLFAFLSLSLLETLSYFFLPRDFLLSFLLESHGSHCPVFTAACLQFIVPAAFAPSSAQQPPMHHKWTCSFQGLALETPGFPFQ